MFFFSWRDPHDTVCDTRIASFSLGEGSGDHGRLTGHVSVLARSSDWSST